MSSAVANDRAVSSGRKKKTDLALVVATKQAISKLKRPLAAGKTAAASNGPNSGPVGGSSVGKKVILAMEVICNFKRIHRVWDLIFKLVVDLEL